MSVRGLSAHVIGLQRVTAGPLLVALLAAGCARGLLRALAVLEGEQLVAAVASLGLLAVAAALGRFERFLLGLLVLSIPFDFSVLSGAQAAGAAGTHAVGLSPMFLLLCILYVLWIVRLLAEPARLATCWPPGATPLLCLMGWSAVSLSNAYDPSMSVRGLVALVKGFLAYLYLANHVKTRNDLRLVAYCFAGTVLMESIIACLQAVMGGSLGLETFGERAADNPVTMKDNAVTVQLGLSKILRVGGTLGHPNQLGRYLASVLPMVFLLATQTRQMGWAMRVVAVGSALLGAIALVLTLSRAAWLSTLAAGVVVVTWLLRHRQMRPRAAHLFVTLLAIGAVVAWLLPLIVARLVEPDAGAIDSRLQLLRMTWTIISTHPILGVGLYNYKLVMHQYDTTGITYEHQYMVHNAYLLLAAEVGLMGLACLGWFLRSVIRRGQQRIQTADEPFTQLVLLGVVGGFITILVSGLVEPLYLLRDTMFMAFAAILASSRDLLAQDRTRGGPA